MTAKMFDVKQISSDVADLDREIDRLAQLLRLCRENAFEELTASIERDVREALPDLECAMSHADNRERRVLAARRKRLQQLLQ